MTVASVARMVIILLLVLSQNAFAQSDGRTFSRFRVLLQSGERFEGRAGRLSGDALSGMSSAGEPVDVPIGSIRALDVSTGSEAGYWAVVGGVIGLSGALLAILQVEMDDSVELNSNAAVAVTAGLTVFGALIGGAIGSRLHKWERVQIQTDVDAMTGGQQRLRVACFSFRW